MDKVKSLLIKNWKKIAIVAAIFIVDILTKIFFEGSSFSLLSGLIGVESTHNTGAAFSIFSGNVGYLVLFSLLFLAFLFFYDSKYGQSGKLYLLSISLMIGGAIGNLFDRLTLGYVRDFIQFEFMPFPIFNVADICLTVGTTLMIICILFFTKGEKNGKNAESK